MKFLKRFFLKEKKTFQQGRNFNCTEDSRTEADTNTGKTSNTRGQTYRTLS